MQVSHVILWKGRPGEGGGGGKTGAGQSASRPVLLKLYKPILVLYVGVWKSIFAVVNSDLP